MKRIILIFLILLPFVARAQQPKTPEFTARQKVRQDFAARAIAIWPAINDVNSRQGEEYAWIYGELLKAHDPILNDDRCPLLIAYEAANRVAEADLMVWDHSTNTLADAEKEVRNESPVGLPQARDWLVGRTASRQAGAPPVVPDDPLLKSESRRIPSNGEVLYSFVRPLMPSTRNTLIVYNGTGENAVAKLIKSSPEEKIRSFAISSGQSVSTSNIPDGSYKLLFAFGETIYVETDHFVDPKGFSRFDDSFVFTTKENGGSTESTKFTVTLNPVAGGTAKASSISKADFERW